MLTQANNTNLKEKVQIQGYPKVSGFPTIFKVCEEHKREFFMDYENARTDIEGECVICFQADNDSLGG
jgi:hypothetical protein